MYMQRSSSFQKWRICLPMKTKRTSFCALEMDRRLDQLLYLLCTFLLGNVTALIPSWKKYLLSLLLYRLGIHSYLGSWKVTAEAEHGWGAQEPPYFVEWSAKSAHRWGHCRSRTNPLSQCCNCDDPLSSLLSADYELNRMWAYPRCCFPSLLQLFRSAETIHGATPHFRVYDHTYLNSRFADKAIWSEKNTVRVWVNPELRWEGDYHPIPTEHSSCWCTSEWWIVTLPFCLGKEQLTSSAEISSLDVGVKCRVIGEVLSVRKWETWTKMIDRFSKTLVFVFVNTSNVFFDSKQDAYFYYDSDAYDSHNACLNMRSILVKLFVGLSHEFDK